jgi:hypothetical protein
MAGRLEQSSKKKFCQTINGKLDPAVRMDFSNEGTVIENMKEMQLSMSSMLVL